MRCVYSIKCGTDLYVGSTFNFTGRMSKHMTCAYSSNTISFKRKAHQPLYIALKLFDPIIKILEHCEDLDEEDLRIREQYYKDQLKPVLNNINAKGLDKERERKTDQKYRIDHKDTIRERKRKIRLENLDHFKEKDRLYREKNRDAINEKQRLKRRNKKKI